MRALQPVHDRWSRSLTVLAYHRILPLEDASAYPLDRDLVSATPEQFEEQMAQLRRHFSPVSLSEVVAHIDGGRPLPRRAVAVTFDDGYSDTYHYAFPILQRYAIPATVFVTTGYIDSGFPFWFELAAFFAQRGTPRTLELDGHTQMLPTGDNPAERRKSVQILQAVLKRMPHSRRTEITNEWARQFAAEADADALALSRPLSWSQVDELASAGVAFGSHTVTHPNLTQLTDNELERELADSKRELEARLQKPVEVLAYPFGTTAAFDDRVITATERQGFKLGVTYVSGANPVRAMSRYALRRHGISVRTTPRYFRAMTSLPSWLA